FEGWNTIGSLSVPVGVDRITYDPASTGLTPPAALSGVFGYSTNRGYREVSELTPGSGYWVKLSGEGYYNVIAPVTKGSTPEIGRDAVAGTSAHITIRDAADRENTLFATEGRVQIDANRFELPPVPPSIDLFDVRFSNNGYVTSSENPIVRFSGVEYPVTINVSNSSNGYTVVDAQTGMIIGEITKGNGSVVVSDERVTSLRLLSNKSNTSEYAFDAVPNPASTKSTISFSVPETQVVTIALFNAMGQQIRTLVNGVVTKGDSSVDLDASELATGTYLVKIVANDFVSTKKINIVR
ncbi:MAG: T9SS type A sorting domain-containing protein, partial [Candidatus Kapaibacterium sp.]